MAHTYTRDYFQNPLKVGEYPEKKDIEYLYISLNLPIHRVAKELNCSFDKVYYAIHKYGIKKSKEQVDKCRSDNWKNKTTEEKNKISENIKKTLSSIDPNIMKNVYKKRSEKYFAKSEEERNLIKHKQTKWLHDENSEKVDKWKEKIRNAWDNKSVEEKEEIKQRRVESRMNKSDEEKAITLSKLQNTWKNHSIEQKEQIKNIKSKNSKDMWNNRTLEEKKKIREKASQTIIQKYGEEYLMGGKIFQKKSKQTIVEKYGVDNVSKNPVIIQKIKAKIPQAMKKAYETKKQNNSYGKSKQEDIIFEKLITKFPDTVRQYQSEEYPFACDFYIPSLDLYIEYQGFAGHGKEPFDENNPKHLAIVEEWKNRANESNFKNEKKTLYLRFINSWTVRDPLKRKTARQNNLNWIEFFTEKEFDKWFKEVSN